LSSFDDTLSPSFSNFSSQKLAKDNNDDEEELKNAIEFSLKKSENNLADNNIFLDNSNDLKKESLITKSVICMKEDNNEKNDSNKQSKDDKIDDQLELESSSISTSSLFIVSDNSFVYKNIISRLFPFPRQPLNYECF
jgi:hypothetical protein